MRSCRSCFLIGYFCALKVFAHQRTSFLWICFYCPCMMKWVCFSVFLRNRSSSNNKKKTTVLQWVLIYYFNMQRSSCCPETNRWLASQLCVLIQHCGGNLKAVRLSARYVLCVLFKWQRTCKIDSLSAWWTKCVWVPQGPHWVFQAIHNSLNPPNKLNHRHHW